ncbi:MAG: BBP7 family outer membrane beta-barrel protein [Planctomycetota bacterium]
MRVHRISRCLAGALWAASLTAMTVAPAAAQFVGYQPNSVQTAVQTVQTTPVQTPYQNLQGGGYRPVPGPMSGQAFGQTVQAPQTNFSTGGRYGTPSVAGVGTAAPQQFSPVATQTPVGTTFVGQAAASQQAASQSAPPTSYGSQPGYVQPHAAAATSGAFQPGAPQYTAMSMRRAQVPAGGVGAPVVTEPVMPGVELGSPTVHAPMDQTYGQPIPQHAPMGQPGCSTCETGAASVYGCADGSCGVGGCDSGYLGRGLKHGCRPRRQWFGGVYGLLMERVDNKASIDLAYTTSTANGAGYYPHPSEVVMSTRDIDYDYQGGAEVRFGSTFGGGFVSHGGGVGLGGGMGGGCGCDAGCCGGCGCGPRWAWEGVYWGLAEDDTQFQVFDTAGDAWRTYGKKPWVGAQYDAGAGARPLNDYYDYGNPVGTNDVEIRSLTMRTNFSMQNAEFNLIKLPQLNCGCGSRCSISSVFGFRFLRFDDNFFLRSDWENTTSAATGYVEWNSLVDNELYGAQWGCNGVYHLGCQGKWALHCNTVVGVFANDMEATRFFTGGDVTYSNEGTPVASTVSDEDFAMLGEIRAGISYRPWCHWRLYGGWRALAISGVALSVDQTPHEFSTSNNLAYIHSNGSLIVHGLQAGVEWMF